jgi:hypothetical protein
MTSFKGGIVGGCRNGSWKAGASKLGAFHGRPGISIKVSKYRHLRFFLGAQKKSKVIHKNRLTTGEVMRIPVPHVCFP